MSGTLHAFPGPSPERGERWALVSTVHSVPKHLSLTAFFFPPLKYCNEVSLRIALVSYCPFYFFCGSVSCIIWDGSYFILYCTHGMGIAGL